MEIRHFFKYYKSIFRYVWLRIEFYFKHFWQHQKKDTFCLHIPDARLARYLYLNVHYFRHLFTIYLQPSFALLTQLRDYSHWIIKEPQVFLRKTNLLPNSGKLTHNQKTYDVQISYDYFTALTNPQPNQFIMPYFMHPGQHKKKYREKLTFEIEKKRPLNVLFLGGVNKENYDKQLIQDVFHISSRYNVISFLKSQIPYLKLQDEKEIHEFICDRRREMIIYNTYKTLLWQEEWLYTLSQVDFYLALPGVSMPLCHNLFEAMSVGAIPILQHHKFVYPALEPGKNCLNFNTLEGLVALLKSVPNMPEEQIQKMRGQALAYYERYHSVEGFTKNFQAFLQKANPEEPLEVVLNAEQLSVQHYNRQQYASTN